MNWEAAATGMDCLSLAIAFHQAPSHFPDLLRGKAVLPAHIDALLHLAGGGPLDEGLHKPAFVSVDDLRAAARFFIENVLLARDADHYRVLGVNPDASIEEIKEHHRLLMRVFHPDRARQDGSDAVAARINLAYNALRHPSERAAYDAKRRHGPKAAAPIRPPSFRRAHAEHKSLTQRLPPVVARHLPQFVLGSVAVLSTLAVGLVYVSREPGGAIGGGEGALASRLEPRAPIAVLQKPAAPAIAPDVEPLLARARAQRAAELASAKADKGNTRNASLASPAATTPAQALEVAPQRPVALELVAESRSREPIAKAPAEPAVPVSDVVRTEAPHRAEPVVAAPSPEQSTAPAVAVAVAPAPAAIQVAMPEPTPGRPALARRAINEDELIALVEKLSGLYERGDLEAFMALFDEGARIERGDRRRIRADYEELFRSTDARQLVIWDMKWAPEGDLFRGEGNYQARVVRKGEDKARVYAGKITLEAVPVNGAPRLRGMFH